MVKQPRRLSADEVEALLALDVPAHLATLDTDGFPHVTPLWFLWDDGAFYMTSIADRPHLKRLQANPRAGLVVAVEDPERVDGQRPNQQARAIGDAELFLDEGASWTRRVTGKYIRGPGATASAVARAADERIVIRVRPIRLLAVGSV